MEKKEGFSYESPEKTKGRAVKILILELLALVIVVVGIIGILGYMRIGPFAQLLSDVPFIGRDIEIEAVSDIEGYSIKIEDERGLINLMSEWEVFTKEYSTNIYSEGSLGDKPLKKIILRLTDKVQNANRYSADGGKTYYTSSYAKLSDGTMEILIHIDDQFFEGRDAKLLPLDILSQVVTILYKMTRDVTNPVEIQARDREITQILQKIAASNRNYIVVIRE